ncbi:hypothetical protein DW181_06350 [Clostridium sp. AM16-23]|nr:hypothetical protein DW181_06350 [Clostridium sp. AM16-23]RHS62176.1 hypothetical protein DW954_16140 [Clostridium sp. AM45-5]
MLIEKSIPHCVFFYANNETKSALERDLGGCQALSGAGCLCRRNGTYGNADGCCPEKELHSRGVSAFYHTGKF